MSCGIRGIRSSEDEIGLMSKWLARRLTIRLVRLMVEHVCS
jgi:hypothetical protein